MVELKAQGDKLQKDLQAKLERERVLALERERALASRAFNTITFTRTASASTAGNTYGYGYCTWYVKNRKPNIPNGLGNANTWFSRVSSYGLSTGSTPRVGAVAQTSGGALGHVAIVESVNGDGTITISEMNYAGWNRTSSRTVSASQFRYIY